MKFGFQFSMMLFVALYNLFTNDSDPISYCSSGEYTDLRCSYNNTDIERCDYDGRDFKWYSIQQCHRGTQCDMNLLECVGVV